MNNYKQLEVELLKMWDDRGIEEIYKYKNRINVYKGEDRATITLFYDLTYGLFEDVYDIANDSFTRPDEEKVNVKELLKKRKGEQIENDK